MSEVNIKAIEKQIDYELSVKNNFWNATALSVGGTIGLFFLSYSLLKIGFIILGVIFSLVFIKGYFNRYEGIQCLIKELKKMR